MKISFTGLEEVTAALTDLAPREARNIMRNTVNAIAGKIRDDARAGAPVGQSKKLKKSIKSKRVKAPPDKPESQVYVEPAAFYWKFLEYGTVKLTARPFILPAKEKIDADRDEIFRVEFGKKFEAAVARGRGKK